MFVRVPFRCQMSSIQSFILPPTLCSPSRVRRLKFVSSPPWMSVWGLGSILKSRYLFNSSIYITALWSFCHLEFMSHCQICPVDAFRLWLEGLEDFTSSLIFSNMRGIWKSSEDLLWNIVLNAFLLLCRLLSTSHNGSICRKRVKYRCPGQRT